MAPPLLKTFSNDNGKWYLDQWHADNKPYFSTRIQARLRAAKAAALLIGTPLCLFGIQWDQLQEQHCFQAITVPAHEWYASFTQFDKFEVLKANSVNYPKDPLLQLVRYFGETR